MAGYLIAEEGPLTGLVIRMEEGTEWIIGRDPDTSFQVLEDPMVSRKHLICRLTDEGFLVENLSSTNPASVNGNPITDPIKLHEGDIVRIGNTLFRFSETDSNLHPSTPDASEVYPTIFEEETPLDTLSLNEVTNARWMLKVISGPNTGAEFGLELDSEYLIGKDPHTCDIIFQDLSVSRQHAKITLDEHQYVTIEDLKSRNGTYVNGKAIETPIALSSQDLIALGTTSFLLIDREQTRETIYSPTSAISQVYETSETEKDKEEALQGKKGWKKLSIPSKHLVLAGTFFVLLLAGVISAISLFKTSHVEIAQTDDQAVLSEALKRFPGVEYSFNPTMGKIFILGDVLTDVDKQELLYLLKSFPFIQSIEDNVVVDEIVWGDMNVFLARNPSWRAVNMAAYAPGKFVLKGYVETMEDSVALMQYVTMNFPYHEKLKNEVVVANTLEMQIQNILIEKGFLNVAFQLGNGELVLSGRVNQESEQEFMDTLKTLKKISGIRFLKNFVIITTASTARINLSDKYKVTGTSKLDNVSQYVVINGQILTTGDTLDGMMITQVEEEAVLLEKDGLKYKINYNQQ
jgi:type III secretion system YscD/HrpQ family protein